MPAYLHSAAPNLECLRLLKCSSLAPATDDDVDDGDNDDDLGDGQVHHLSTVIPRTRDNFSTQTSLKLQIPRLSSARSLSCLLF